MRHTCEGPLDQFGHVCLRLLMSGERSISQGRPVLSSHDTREVKAIVVVGYVRRVTVSQQPEDCREGVHAEHRNREIQSWAGGNSVRHLQLASWRWGRGDCHELL